MNTKISFTTTALARPEILRQTYSSFAKNIDGISTKDFGTSKVFNELEQNGSGMNEFRPELELRWIEPNCTEDCGKKLNRSDPTTRPVCGCTVRALLRN